jgi:hypothetical protein
LPRVWRLADTQTPDFTQRDASGRCQTSPGRLSVNFFTLIINLPQTIAAKDFSQKIAKNPGLEKLAGAGTPEEAGRRVLPARPQRFVACLRTPIA